MATAMSLMVLGGDAMAFDRACADRQPAPFSRLGSRIAALGLSETSNLLAVRLLSHEAKVCDLAYEIEVLFDDGLIEVFTFDAESLVQIDIDDRDQWHDFSDEDDRDDEDEFEDDEDEVEDEDDEEEFEDEGDFEDEDDEEEFEDEGDFEDEDDEEEFEEDEDDFEDEDDDDGDDDGNDDDGDDDE